MIIIPVYAHFQMLRRRLMRLTGQTIACYLLQSLTLRVALAYLAYVSMFCLTQERGRWTIPMKRQRHGFGLCVKSAAVLQCVVVYRRPSNFVYLVGSPILLI